MLEESLLGVCDIETIRPARGYGALSSNGSACTASALLDGMLVHVQTLMLAGSYYTQLLLRVYGLLIPIAPQATFITGHVSPKLTSCATISAE